MLVGFRSVIGMSFSSTSGAFTTATICNLNSLFDVWAASGTVSATGVPQWFGTNTSTNNGLYNKATVVAFKLTLEVNNLQAANFPMTVGMAFRNTNSVAPASFAQLAGKEFATKVRNIDPGANGDNRQTFSLYGSTAAVWGATRENVQVEDNFAHIPTAASPTNLCIADICLQTVDASTTQTLYVVANLLQYCILSGPKTETVA